MEEKIKILLAEDDTNTGLFTGTAGGITVPAATYTQDPVTGAWGINPGVSTLVISGTV